MDGALALTGHLLHSAIVLGGLVGLAALLSPRLAQRAGLMRPPDSVTDRRVAELRRRVATGTLTAPTTTPPLIAGGGAEPLPAPSPERDGDRGSADGDPWLAVAIVGSAAAAGVHAAVAPMHLGPYPLLAAGFLLVALLQVVWPLAVLAASGADAAASDAATATRLAATGLALQGACLTAWVVSRSSGLPWGLHGEGPLPVGPWDLAAIAWQAVAVSWCVAHLLGRRSRTAGRLRPGWQLPATRAFLGGTAVVLVLLTLSGASA